MSDSGPLVYVAVGFATALFLQRAISPVFSRLFHLLFSVSSSSQLSALDGTTGAGDGDGVYGLDHGRLNIPVPSDPSMWMNMGFWRDAQGDFPTACRALLHEVLLRAGLVEYLPRTEDTCSGGAAEADGTCDPVLRESVLGLTVLDLGYGCGDQTLELERLAHGSGKSLRYVGATMSATQHRLAQRRVGALLDLQRPQQEGKRNSSPARKGHDMRLFRADAARPRDWEPGLAGAVADVFFPSSPMGLGDEERREAAAVLDDDEEADGKRARGAREDGPGWQTWVLALDTLYHFRPSRRPILRHAACDLRSPLAAFDVLLSDSATRWQRCLLAVAGWAAGCPLRGAFVTEREYRAMLIDAGYLDGGRGEGGGDGGFGDPTSTRGVPPAIEFTDITEHVFAPLGAFMARRERELGALGLGMGPLRVAGSLFRWWARSGVVRAVVVVARRPRGSDGSG